jgi:hypothetical protein
MEPADLLKQATNRKMAGDLESAIKLLRDAYKGIGQKSIIYPVNTFLRLPAYLQEAGKSDDAWRELNNLLTKGFPNQMRDPEIVPMEHSEIYDAMRLFLQREGKSESAVKFGALSYVSWCLGLYRQKRKDELKTYASHDSIASVVTKLLKKAKKEELTEKLVGILQNHINELPNSRMAELARKIDEVVMQQA